MACSACLNLPLFWYLLLSLDSSDCLVCLNFELLICPSSLVLPFSIASFSPGSWLLFPHLDLTLLASRPNTNWPRVFPVFPQCLICPCCWSWVSLACLTLLLVMSQRWPMVLIFTVKIRFVSFYGFIKYMKAYLLTKGLCRWRNREVLKLSRGGLPLSSVESFSYHPAKY